MLFDVAFVYWELKIVVLSKPNRIVGNCIFQSKYWKFYVMSKSIWNANIYCYVIIEKFRLILDRNSRYMVNIRERDICKEHLIDIPRSKMRHFLLCKITAAKVQTLITYINIDHLTLKNKHSFKSISASNDLCFWSRHLTSMPNNHC